MRPADEQHNVTRANQHYVSAFQAKACVDNRAARVQRKFISFNVLAFITGRRNSDVQGAGLARRLAGFMNRSGGGAGENDYIATRDRSAERHRCLAQRHRSNSFSRSHDAYFYFHFDEPNSRLTASRFGRGLGEGFTREPVSWTIFPGPSPSCGTQTIN